MSEAEQVLVEGLVVHPTLSGAHLLLAMVREAAGDRAGAMEACRNLESLDSLNRALPDLLERLALPPVYEAESAPTPATAHEPPVAPPPAPPELPAKPRAAPEADLPVPTVAPVLDVEAAVPESEPAAPQDLDFFEPFVVSPERAELAQTAPEPSMADALPAPAPAPAPVSDAAVPGNVPQTRTLAELYVAQGHTARAIGVYETLRARHPEDQGLARRLGELRGEPALAEAAGSQPAPAAGPALSAPPAAQPRPAAPSPFDGVEGLEDFSLWLETLPVLPEVSDAGRVS